MIHLDTHVVVWLYEGRVELALLHEIGKVLVPPAVVLDALSVDADLGRASSDFERVSAVAATLSWTRDPFDRLIAAHAMADDLPLITKDRTLLAHCPVARWDAPSG